MIPELHIIFKVETLNWIQLGLVYLYALSAFRLIQFLKWVRIKLRKNGE